MLWRRRRTKTYSFALLCAKYVFFSFQDNSWIIPFWILKFCHFLFVTIFFLYCAVLYSQRWVEFSRVDVQMLKSLYVVIVSAWPEFHLLTVAFPRTSSWHAVNNYCQFNEAHTAPRAFWPVPNCRVQNEVDFREFSTTASTRVRSYILVYPREESSQPHRRSCNFVVFW